MPTSVLNIRVAQGFGERPVYIGRAAGAVWVWHPAPGYGAWLAEDGRELAPHEDGYLGNPVVAEKRCPMCGGQHARRHRVALMACYAVWLARRLRQDADFAARVAMLRGRALGCYCAPRACHGDLLAAAADGRAFCGSCGTTRASAWVTLGGDLFCGACYGGRFRGAAQVGRPSTLPPNKRTGRQWASS
jgi:hypothetical protein